MLHILSLFVWIIPGVAMEISQPQQSQKNHETGCKNRRRLRLHYLQEKAEPMHRRIHFFLKLHATPIVQGYANAPGCDERPHEDSQKAYSRCASGYDVPREHNETHGDQYDRHELRHVLVMAQENQLYPRTD